MKAIALVGLLLLWVSLSQDPSALIEQLRSEDIAVRERAYAELEKLGAAAESHLKKAAEESDASVSRSARRLLRILELDRVFSPALKKAFPGLARRLASGDDQEWTRTYLSGTSYPELTRTDLEPLAVQAIEHAVSENLVEACRLTVRWFHTSARSALRTRLRHPLEEVRNAAGNALQGLAGLEAAEDVVAELKDHPVWMVKGIDNLNWDARRVASQALGAVLEGPDSSATLLALELLQGERISGVEERAQALLKSDQLGVRLKALEYLKSVEAVGAAAEVLTLLRDEDSRIRLAAVQWFHGMRQPIPDPVMEILLADAEPEIVVWSLAVWATGPGPKPHVAKVRALVHHKNARLQEWTLRMLLMHLPTPDAALLLRELVAGTSPELRKAALPELSSRDPDGAATILLRILENQDESPTLRESAFDELKSLGRAPAPARLADLMRDAVKRRSFEVAVKIGRHLVATAPQTIRGEVPELLRRKEILDAWDAWAMLDALEPSQRPSLLIHALKNGLDQTADVAYAFERIKTEGAEPGLLALLETDERKLQVAVLQILGHLRFASARPRIAALVDAESSEVRCAALETLNRLGPGDDLPLWRKALGDADDKLRERAVTGLVARRAIEAVPDLLARLDDEAGSVQKAAARGLAGLGCRDLIPKMLDWVEAEPKSDLAVEILAILHAVEVTPAVRKLLDHRDVHKRRIGIRLVHALGLRDLASRLIPLLREPLLAELAADTIIVLDAKDLISRLEETLGDPGETTRRHVLRALTDLDAKESAPRIRALLKDRFAEVRRLAAAGLGLLGDKASVPALIEAVGDRNQGVRCAAAASLGNIGDPSAGSALIPLLEDVVKAPWHPVLKSVARLRVVEATPRLRRLLGELRPGWSDEVTRTLAALGAKEAIPDVVRLLERPEDTVHAAAALAVLAGSEARAEISKRLKPGIRDEVALGVALAAAGDDSALLRALESGSPTVRGQAAYELIWRGDRRGIPVLLNAEHVHQAWILNSIRAPAEWARLERTRWPLRIEGCRSRVVDRLASLAGMTVEWVGQPAYRDLAWRFEWTRSGYLDVPMSVSSGLTRVVASSDYCCGTGPGQPAHEYIIEGDMVRILSREAAVAFWRRWWAEEQVKKK